MLSLRAPRSHPLQIKVANAPLHVVVEDPCLPPGQSVTQTHTLATMLRSEGSLSSLQFTASSSCMQLDNPSASLTSTSLTSTVSIVSLCQSPACAPVLSTAAIIGISVASFVFVGVLVAVVVGVRWHYLRTNGKLTSMKMTLAREQPEYQKMMDVPKTTTNTSTADDSAFTARYG